MKLTKSSFIYCLLSFSIIALISTSAYAFKPFREAGHAGISTAALEGISRNIEGEELTFTDTARAEILRANAFVDANQGNEAAHFDGESLVGGSARLMSLKESAITSVLGSSANGFNSRNAIGRAFHTIQDFFSHSNFVESGFAVPDFGNETIRPVGPTVETCVGPDSLILGVGPTSGYFALSDFIGCSDDPVGKCRHGFGACPGINKDVAGIPGFAAAETAATTASRRFVESILDDPRIADNPEAIKAIFGLGGTLGFVIDDTGSMGPILASVRSNVRRIITNNIDPNDLPAQYLLQTFNDPTVGTPQTFNEFTSFLPALDAVTANGGGDCPELAWTGTFRAVDASLTVSQLFLFTDAAPKDASLASNVISLARRKKIQIYPILNGNCSPFDPTFFEVAEATGGQVFLIDTDESGSIFNLIAPLIRNNVVPVLAINATLDNQPKSYLVPVDDTISEITFSVSVENLSLVELRTPSGDLVENTLANVTITNLVRGAVYTVVDPEDGNWEITVTGNGDASISVDGQSPLALANFEFVEFGGRPDHEGFFALEGNPIALSNASVVADVSGEFSSASFVLRDLEGNDIVNIAAETGNEEIPAQTFLGETQIPQQEFLAYAIGETASGEPFSRILPGKFTPTTVEIRRLGLLDFYPVGSTANIEFSVFNRGDEDREFEFTVTDAVNSVTTPSSGLISIASGESEVISLAIAISENATPFIDIPVSLSVVSTDGDRLSNAASLSLETIPSNQNPICTDAIASPNVLEAPNRKFNQIDINGITDPDGDELSINVVSVTQDEVVKNNFRNFRAKFKFFKKVLYQFKRTNPRPNFRQFYREKLTEFRGPDAKIEDDGTLFLKAERDAKGDGRVYAADILVEDGNGGQCTATVNVSVPKKGNVDAIDSGQDFDSLSSE